MEELSPLDVETHLVVCKYRPPELPENEKLRCTFVEFGCEEKFEDEPELQRHVDQQIQKHLMVKMFVYFACDDGGIAAVVTSILKVYY